MISQKSDTRKLLVVYNPAAGNHTERIREKVESTLSEKPLTFKFNPTSPNGNIDFKESAAISPFTEVIIIGGDGTINAVINSIDLRIPVAIIPSGTGNDFVKMLSIGRTIEEQIQTALTGELIDVDLGICNGHLFANGIGIGFDGQIVEDMAVKRVPFLRGHAAYYFHVLRILGGYKEKQFSYEADGKKYDEKLILLTIGNGSTFGGGFKLMPNANLSDGYLEICEIGPVSGLKRFLNINKLSKGTHGQLKEVTLRRAKSLKIAKNESLFAHMDGERLGNPPFDISILPKALKIRVRRSSDR